MLPTSVLTSANADYTFLKSLEDKLATLSLPPSATATASSSAAASTTDTETATGKIQIEYRPARDFYSTAGKHALNRVKVLDSDHDDSEPRELEEEIERMLDDRATRQIELGLEALLNNLSANPLTVRIAAQTPYQPVILPTLITWNSRDSLAAPELCSSTCRPFALELATCKVTRLSSAPSSCSGCPFPHLAPYRSSLS